MKQDDLTVVDLFCGCGGLSLGFQRAGFHVVAAIDSWRPAVETYNRNFDHECAQIFLADDVELPTASVFIGGPPCQGFSSAGLRKPGDERNSLVGVFSKLVAKHKPRFFVFENVEGFLTGSNPIEQIVHNAPSVLPLFSAQLVDGQMKISVGDASILIQRRPAIPSDEDHDSAPDDSDTDIPGG